MTRRRFGGRIAAVVAAVVAVAVWVAVPRTNGEGPAWPRAFVDPVERVYVMDAHSEALVAWAREGVRDAVVVHVDAHHDLMTPRGAEYFEPLRAALERGDWDALARAGAEGAEDPSYTLANYLAPAHHLGLVRHVWWVIPLPRSLDEAFLSWFRAYLTRQQAGVFGADEAAALRLEGRHVVGTLRGVPVTITAWPDLPSFEEPVLLDIDCDYFSGEPDVSGGIWTWRGWAWGRCCGPSGTRAGRRLCRFG